MNSFVVFIYLCAASTAPADCDRRTAIDVVLGPQATNELTCGLGAQEMMAKTAIRPKTANTSRSPACATKLSLRIDNARAGALHSVNIFCRPPICGPVAEGERTSRVFVARE